MNRLLKDMKFAGDKVCEAVIFGLTIIARHIVRCSITVRSDGRLTLGVLT